MLAYYRNSLTHVFINETYIACALRAFGISVIEEQGVSIQRLHEQSEFLACIFKEEFLVREQIESQETFLKHLEIMEKRNFISIEQKGD